MPLFDYADFILGGRHNVTLMSSWQNFAEKGCQMNLDRPIYSSAMHVLATLK